TFGAPYLSEVTSGHLREKVPGEENAGGKAGLTRREAKFMLERRNSERKISAIDVGYGVHQKRSGDDAIPSVHWRQENPRLYYACSGMSTIWNQKEYRFGI